MKRKRRFKKRSSVRKFIITFFAIVLIGFAGMGYELYSRIYQPNILFSKDVSEKYIYIPTEANFLQVLTILSQNGLLINSNSFEWLAKQKKYTTNIKPGRYKIDRPLSNNQLINLLRSGKQDPVNLTFNNLRSKEQLAGKVAHYIEADSISILKYISDQTFQEELSLNNDNVVCIFLPNTYEFYWNTSAEEFVNRMLVEYSKFWNLNRQQKAEDLKLNYYEISILASIVEKEQNLRISERPEIAGLYLNRLRRGIKLESDPTLIFALGDFSIKRVLNKDKKVNSLYNTYMHKGLPPGPICIPSINSIESVLNSKNHDYIFMCAREDFSGFHNFSKNYREHLSNARKYQKALNKRNIMR